MTYQFLVNLGPSSYRLTRPQEVLIVRGPKPASLTLTPPQREVLEHLARCPSAPYHLVCRARLILLAADGLNNTQIAARLRLARARVRIWRTRWLTAAPRLAAADTAAAPGLPLADLIEHLLADAPRPGAPPTFSPEQVVQIVALACEPPADSGRPISHWAARELADEAIQRGIVERISARSVGRFLK